MSKITGKGVGLSGSFWNMLGSGMMAANTVFLTMLVGHVFDMTVIGQFTLALTTSQIMYSIALFGANDRHMTDYQHRFRFNQYFWLRIASLVLSGIICLLAIRLLGKTGDSAVYIILLTCFMMINAFAEIYQSMFFQENRLDLSGKAIFFRYLLSTAAFAVIVIWRHSVTFACIAMILVDLAATWFWDLRFSGTFRDSGYGLERDGFSDLIRETFPLCLSLLSWQFIVNCPKYLIDMWLSTEDQGIYSILFMPVFAMNLLGQIAFRPFLHQYADAWNHDRKQFFRLLKIHIGFISFITLAAAVCAFFLGAPLLGYFFGQNLGEYRTELMLFTASGAILAVNQLLYYLLVILRKQKYVPLFYLSGGILLVISGWKLIPLMRLSGGWIAFSVAQLLVFAEFLTIIIRA